MDPSHPSPAAAVSHLTVRILGSVPAAPSLAEVRKRFLQPPGGARNRIQKRNRTIFLSTVLSTKQVGSCTEVINFSTIAAPALWTLQGPA